MIFDNFDMIFTIIVALAIPVTIICGILFRFAHDHDGVYNGVYNGDIDDANDLHSPSENDFYLTAILPFKSVE